MPEKTMNKLEMREKKLFSHQEFQVRFVTQATLGLIILQRSTIAFCKFDSFVCLRIINSFRSYNFEGFNDNFVSCMNAI